MLRRISFSAALLLALLSPPIAHGQQLFNNFPISGQISAFQVSGSYSSSNSFTLTSGATVGQIAFGAWVSTGDAVTAVTWSIGTTPFGASFGSGVAAAASVYDLSNADGFDVNSVTFAIPGVTLPAGTYYLTLSAAVSAHGNAVYWDINDAAGVDAWDSSYGHVSASNTCFQTIGISGTCALSFEILSAGASLTAMPPSLTFASQTVNTASTAQSVTITNNGPGAASISGVSITGTNASDFSQTNNCPLSPATLALNGACTINVTFTPQAAGMRSAAISISGGSPLSVSLSGTGTAVASTVTLSPTSISFPNQTVNTTSGAQAITLTNSGPSPLTISSIAVTGTNSGDFAETNNCPVSPATVAVNGVCTINVTFTPLAASLFSAAITVTDNGSGSPQSASLSGTGTAVPSTVTLSPTSISFPNQTVNTTSGAQAITLTNSGPSPLTISSIAVTGTNSGDFAETNNCPVSPATIAVNGVCTINVTFT
ncbi:MAG TPA: choice-of-anchor D domain-containing protein, partial [Bryobacteraceae bacterium]